jgi:hypothetical protein
VILTYQKKFAIEKIGELYVFALLHVMKLAEKIEYLFSGALYNKG